MSKNLPRLTEGDIRQLSNEQSFSRGQDYYRGGALFELVCQENELRAYCEGSSYEPYRVSAMLGPQGIERTHCTCPYDWGGICKHRVALLLTWVHEPESFHEVAPLEELLADRSREELVALIKEMLKREPDLVRLLELPIRPDRQTPLDLEAFRRQIDYALRQQGYHDYHDYPSAGAVAAELTHLVENARRFLEGGDWANAGALFALILNEVVPRYGELYDEDGDVAVVLQSCAEGLDDCFIAGEPDNETRRQWLAALLEAHLKDIEMGGIDLSYPAGELVVGHATDEEWDWIEERVQQAITAQTGGFSEWRRESLVGFLAQRMEVTDKGEAVDDLILNQGSPRQQAFLLVERGRFDEAITVARQHFEDLPGLVTHFADALVEAGAGDQAAAYVAGLLDTRSRSTCLTWLAHYSESTGDLSGAVDWWRQSLQQTPSHPTYQTIRELAERLGVWDEIRSELLAELEDKQVWQVLMEIALEQGDVPWALELLPRLRGWYSSDYELRVAEAAEIDHPQVALDIYLDKVKKLIEWRGRQNYQIAAGLLSRVREIYRQRLDEDSWQAYITELRQANSNLPALQDELNKAGL